MLPDQTPQTPLPDGYDFGFWTAEVERASKAVDTQTIAWQENIDWYAGKSPDAAKHTGEDWVNINADFYQTEQKLAQLFYETPDLQLAAKGALTIKPPVQGMPGAPAPPPQVTSILAAHRALLNELLGDDHAMVLARAIHPAIKDCLTVSGVGPVILGYDPTLKAVPAPQIPGQVLGLLIPTQVPIYEQWYALRFSAKKFLKPADWTSTDWDRAPWLGMRFRMPLAVGIRQGLVPADFDGTAKRDEYVLNETAKQSDASGVKYIDGQMLFYRAADFDPNAAHPELYRELVLVEGMDAPARHRDSPHQTVLPNGRLSGDSMIGNPIHPLSIRFVPDSADTPSDATMCRPLVRELCKFRSQMVQERDASRPRVLYDVDAFPPEVLKKLQDGTVGDLIGLEGGKLTQGVGTIMAQAVTGGAPRQTYLANDVIQRDLERTLAMDATGAGVTANDSESATKTAIVQQNRNVRMDHERRQVLRWYIQLVSKFSALVCRYMNPLLAQQLIGPEGAQAWMAWDKQSADARVAFSAKPDSQIRLDAAAEFKKKLDLYQFTAKDPQVNRVELLKELFLGAGYDPAKLVTDQPPPKQPQEAFSFTFKGEDLIGPQAPMVREILAQGGIQISPDAIQESATQLMQQVQLGLRDANGKATPALVGPAPHGGTAPQVRPLSQQSADQSGQRDGRPSMEAA